LTELTIQHKKSWKERIELGRIIGVVTTLLLVFLGSYYFEDIKEHFPDITTLQLKSYDWLSRITSRTPRPQWVVGVEIDGTTFYDCLGLVSNQDVTDRAFLAGLIDRAVQAKASVIALDINLDRDAADQSDPVRRAQNRAFFDAIGRAQAANIPVVLTQGFDYRSLKPLDDIRDGRDTSEIAAAAPDRWSCGAGGKPAKAEPPSGKRAGTSTTPRSPMEVSNRLVSHDAEAASASGPPVRAGFDFAPMDMRKVPLTLNEEEERPESAEKAVEKYPSFALQVVDAYEMATGIKPRSAVRLEDQMQQGYFVYTSFLPEYSHFAAGPEPSLLDRGLHWLDTVFGAAEMAPPDAPPDEYKFPHVSAKDVYNGDPAALAKLEHRIVLVGGHREARPGSSEWLDYHRGPQGPMLGMYLHANYVEGLLDNRIKLRIGRWTGVVLDVGLALLIMIAGAKAHKFWQRTLVIVVASLFVLLLYLAAADLGYCLDVLAVLLIMFVHTGWEHYLHLQERAHEERGSHAAHG
jgi:CHASE2 domain-containing sensor protein